MANWRFFSSTVANGRHVSDTVANRLQIADLPLYSIIVSIIFQVDTVTNSTTSTRYSGKSHNICRYSGKQSTRRVIQWQTTHTYRHTVANEMIHFDTVANKH